ncbi:uncharacterized protein BKA78DRAFT_310328 [Phyllosticta capitalensis]|uniref:uncharacterized protein n=1 Tax=Phyllosticta capitalensis TaxID=121624 RepID=UPI00312FA332
MCTSTSSLSDSGASSVLVAFLVSFEVTFILCANGFTAADGFSSSLTALVARLVGAAFFSSGICADEVARARVCLFGGGARSGSGSLAGRLRVAGAVVVVDFVAGFVAAFFAVVVVEAGCAGAFCSDSSWS